MQNKYRLYRRPGRSITYYTEDCSTGKREIVGAPGEIGSHTLRKTFARLLYAALGHDLVRTSYALRHRSVATTVSYLSFREEEVDAAIVGV